MTHANLPKTTVEDIAHLTSNGPWKAKSGGDLIVRLALPSEAVTAFLDYENPAFDAVEADSGVNIRGLRSYTVDNIPKGSIGGREWHMARTEYVGALGGSALWQCVDLSGNEREFVLDGTAAVIMPPGILHTYQALEDNTRLQIIYNTLFVPEDPKTHDTFSRESFENAIRSVE